MNGVILVSTQGYAYPNRTQEEQWLTKVAFFQGRLLKHPDAFKLINDKYQAANKTITPEIQILLNMLDFNPFTEDLVQYHWFDGTELYIPQGEWKWPILALSMVFDEEGCIVQQGTHRYDGWNTDYKMYTYEESKILEAVKKICEGE